MATQQPAERSAADGRGLTRFQLDVLYMVANVGPEYGLGLKEELEDYYDEQIPHSRLYINLDDLVDQELLAKSQRDRRTNEYALTGRGRELLRRDAQWRTSIAEDISARGAADD